MEAEDREVVEIQKEEDEEVVELSKEEYNALSEALATYQKQNGLLETHVSQLQEHIKSLEKEIEDLRKKAQEKPKRNLTVKNVEQLSAISLK